MVRRPRVRKAMSREMDVAGVSDLGLDGFFRGLGTEVDPGALLSFLEEIADRFHLALGVRQRHQPGVQAQLTGIRSGAIDV